MITLLTHINHVIEAPMLDAYDENGMQIKYFALLWDEETGKKTSEFPSEINKIDEDGASTNENSIVTFHFYACGKDTIYGPLDGYDIFDDGAKVTLEIYNSNHEEAWYKKKAYKIKHSKITCQL